MIRRVILENFMGYATTTIDFNSTTNAIIGNNDTGKSAVFHAVRWVVLNSPKGESIIREDHDICAVTIQTDHGTVKKTRKRNAGTTWEMLQIAGGETVKNSYHTSEPPPGLDDILKLGDVSFAMQHDTPYLIGCSGSEASDTLGTVSGINILDEATDIVGAALSQAKASLKLQEVALKDTDIKVAMLSAIDSMRDRLTALATSETENELKTITLGSLLTLKDTSTAVLSSILGLEAASKVLATVSYLSSAMLANDSVVVKSKALNSVYEAICELKATIEKAVIAKDLLVSLAPLNKRVDLMSSNYANELEFRNCKAAIDEVLKLRKIYSKKAEVLQVASDLASSIADILVEKLAALTELLGIVKVQQSSLLRLNKVQSKFDVLAPLVVSHTTNEAREALRIELSSILHHRMQIQKDIEASRAKVLRIAEKLAIKQKELKNLDGQVCPLCGGDIKNDKH